MRLAHMANVLADNLPSRVPENVAHKKYVQCRSILLREGTNAKPPKDYCTVSPALVSSGSKMQQAAGSCDKAMTTL